MKKLLIVILIILLAILTVFITVKGLQIGNIQILGIKQIKEKNEELDAKIQKATKLASTDFNRTLNDLQENAKLLNSKKSDYEEMVSYSTEEQVETANQFYKYEIEYLWTQIGIYAKKEGVVIKIDVVNSASLTENVYNLKFTVNGSYIGICEFISGIENDSNLGFKIEEFSMKPGSSETDIQANFVCKDIFIKDIQNTSTQTNNDSSSSTQETKDEKDKTNNSNKKTIENLQNEEITDIY